METIEKTLLDKIRLNLRIEHSILDSDILDDIESCKLDLKRVGIDTNKHDALMEKAIKLYLRWQYNFENQAERYQKAYIALRNSMSLCGDYKLGDLNV